MTGNECTVQLGYWGKEGFKEKKKRGGGDFTGAAHSAANPKSHKYERVP